MNRYITPNKFQMMLAIRDLKDVYFHVSVKQEYLCFLQFVIDQKFFQFTVLPFTLLTAPMVFRKYMAQVPAFLRERKSSSHP